MRHWLLKSEPDVFSIDDLAAAPDRTTYWDGVRNYQARNFLRDDFRLGDRVLFYHSNAAPPAVAGIAEVVREAYPDFTALDPQNPHYDPTATADEPRWVMVDIRLVEKFARPVTLDELRELPDLASMELLRRGSRLSVQPVRPAEFAQIERLARSPAAAEPALEPGGAKRSRSSSKRTARTVAPKKTSGKKPAGKKPPAKPASSKSSPPAKRSGRQAPPQ